MTTVDFLLKNGWFYNQKGIPLKLLAFEQLLADHPELAGSVVLVQVAYPPWWWRAKRTGGTCMLCIHMPALDRSVCLLCIHMPVIDAVCFVYTRRRLIDLSRTIAGTDYGRNAYSSDPASKEYAALRAEVNGLVGRINGKYGTASFQVRNNDDFCIKNEEFWYQKRENLC